MTNCRRSSVTSLSHSASTSVYNTMGVAKRVARVCLWQLRLVNTFVKQGDYETSSICLSVFLSFSVSAGVLKDLWTDLHEMWRIGSLCYKELQIDLIF